MFASATQFGLTQALAAMKNSVALGTVTFAVLSIVIGLAAQFFAERFGAESALAGRVGTFLVAIPLALWGARRVGRVTRTSLFLASVVIALGCLWAVVFILDAVARPAGGHVGWADLFNALNWRNTAVGAAAMVAVPQVWLSLFNRLAANNSSKPTPLRGAA